MKREADSIFNPYLKRNLVLTASLAMALAGVSPQALADEGELPAQGDFTDALVGDAGQLPGSEPVPVPSSDLEASGAAAGQVHGEPSGELSESRERVAEAEGELAARRQEAADADEAVQEKERELEAAREELETLEGDEKAAAEQLQACSSTQMSISIVRRTSLTLPLSGMTRRGTHSWGRMETAGHTRASGLPRRWTRRS